MVALHAGILAPFFLVHAGLTTSLDRYIVVLKLEFSRIIP